MYGMDSKPDLITLSESRINNKKFDENIIEMPGYDFIFDDSPPGGVAGGVGLYIKSGFDYKMRDDLKLKCDRTENIWIQTKLNGKKSIVAVIYRHPKQNFQTFQNALINTIEKVDLERTAFYICGDININLLKFDIIKNSVRHYVDTLHSLNCINVTDKPTRITPTSQTLVDHIYIQMMSATI